MTFGERLDSLRKGMTQKEFARVIGIPLTSYTNWVTGISTPKMEYIVLICSKLGVSADWLLGLSEERETVEREDHRKLEGLKKAIIQIIKEY